MAVLVTSLSQGSTFNIRGYARRFKCALGNGTQSHGVTIIRVTFVVEP